MRAGLLLASVLFACLPNPQSVKERRETFDRDSLQGELLFSEPPAQMRPVGAEFAGKIRLVGYTTDPVTPRRGDSVEVTFFWSANTPLNEDYMVFVHGDAIGGNARRIHGDHYPARGRYPTDVWRPGDIVADPFTVKIEADYGGEQLGIYAGLYKDDYRLPLTDRGTAFADNENRTRAIEITFDKPAAP